MIHTIDKTSNKVKSAAIVASGPPYGPNPWPLLPQRPPFGTPQKKPTHPPEISNPIESPEPSNPNQPSEKSAPTKETP